MTSLAKQLHRLAEPHTQALLGDDRRKRSLLFDPKDAATLDKETFYALGVNGLEELESIDHNFEEFHSSLFSHSSQTFERSVQTRAVNKKLDETISRFLLRLSPYFLLKPAQKALEWLIYRYHIQYYNIDDLMLCILPYHESKIFVRAVQLLTLDVPNASNWEWLQPLQKSGVHLAHSTLTTHCRTNPGFLSFIIDMVPKFIKANTERDEVNQQRLRVMFSFYTTTILGVLDTGEIQENIISTLLPHLVHGLRSKIADYIASTYMIIAQLMHKTKVKVEVLERLLVIICKNIIPSLLTEAVSCILLIFQTQQIDRLSKRAFRHLTRQPALGSTIEKLSGHYMYKIHALLEKLLVLLIPAAFKQAALSVVSSDSSEGEEDAPPPQLMRLLQHLLTCLPLEDSLATMAAKGVLEQYVAYSVRNDLEDLQSLASIVKGVVRQLETRYCKSLEIAVDEVMSTIERKEEKTAITTFLNLSAMTTQHQILPGNEKSLILSLNHSHPSVRKNALEFMFENRDRLEDTSFMSDAVLMRLKDDSALVVETVLKSCENLWQIVRDKIELQECLMKILHRFKNNQNWHKILLMAMKSLSRSRDIFDEDYLPLALSYLFLTSYTDPKEFRMVQHILMSPLAKRNSLLRHVKQDWLKRVTKDKKAKNMSSKTLVELNNMLAKELAQAMLEDKTRNIMEVIQNLFNKTTVVPNQKALTCLLLLTIHQAIHLCQEPELIRQLALRQAELIDNVMSDKLLTSEKKSSTGLKLTKAVEITQANLARNKRIPSEFFLCLLDELIRSSSVPDILLKENFWQYHGNGRTEDDWLKMQVKVFSRLLTLAAESSVAPLAKTMIGTFVKHFFGDNSCLLHFFCLLWSEHANDQSSTLGLSATLQARSLHLGHVQLQLLSKAEVTAILDTPSPVLATLMTVCSSPYEAIRDIALQCLRTLLEKSENGKTLFRRLVTKVLHCQEEITNDPLFLSQVVGTVYSRASASVSDSGASPKKKRRKCGDRSSAAEALESILKVVVASTTPAFISRSLLEMLKLINTVESFQLLLPLMERLLDKCSSGLTFPEAKCLELLIEHFTDDVAASLKLNSLGLKCLMKAIKAQWQPHPKTVQVQQVAIPQITEDFYESLPSSESRQQVFSSLIDAWVSTDNVDVSNGIRRTIKHVTIDADHVAALLKPVLQSKTASTVKEAKRQKKQIGPQVETSVFENADWQQVVVTLEAVQDKKKIVNPEDLVPVCFQIMARALELEEHNSAEYLKQLLLTTVYNICNRFYTEQTDVSVPEEHFNMELIVQCIRTSDNPQTHRQALLVLTVAAKICPEHLLHNIMSVFTFMGANILRQDDSYSFHVITRILETVIPALVMACKEKEKTGKEQSSTPEEVITMVLRVFVDAYLHIPEHRKLMLFTKLVSIVGEEQYLWRTLLLFVENSIVKKKVIKTEEDQEDRQAKSPVPVTELEFMIQLAGFFSPGAQLIAAKDAIGYVSSLPDDKENDDAVRRKSVPQSLGTLKKEDTEIFSLAFHTAKQLRHFKYATVYSLVHIFSGTRFIEQVAENQEVGLLNFFQDLLGVVLHYIAMVTKAVDTHQDQSTAKFWRVYLHKVCELLDKVVSVLPEVIFMEVVSGLMKHKLHTVQRKSMELLNVKLQQLKEITDEQQEALLPLVRRLTTMVKKTALVHKDGEENAVTAQTALYSLKVLCRLLGSRNPEKFLKILSMSTKILSERKDSLPVSACALLCMAEICSCLKVSIIPELPSFMPELISAMKREDSMGNELFMLSCVTAVHKAMENFPSFLSPFLLDITKQVCCLSSPVLDNEVHRKPQIQQRLKGIRHTLATVISTRVFLPTIVSCYGDLAANRQISLLSLMTVLDEHIREMNKEDLSTFDNDLLKFFFKALDFRTKFPRTPQKDLHTIEKSVIDTFITMVMKLSEATFRPMLFKLFDWATMQDSSKNRVLVFYRLADSLAEKLKSLFTLFAGNIVKHAARTLNENNTAKTDTKYFTKGSKASAKSSQLLQYVLDCLHKCFLHDSGDFVNKEVFDSLMQPIVDQIENLQGTEKKFEERISEHLVPCIAQFAVTAQDDSLWRIMNYQILLKTRNSSPQVRLAALNVIDEFHKKLGEDYMPLLPETIPFLAELMEDEAENVEKRCQSVIADMEKTLGEPLQKYF